MLLQNYEKIGVVGFDDTETDNDAAEGGVKKRLKSGGFQAMGLSFPVLKGVLKRGYKVPTPIQRKVSKIIFFMYVRFAFY